MLVKCKQAQGKSQIVTFQWLRVNKMNSHSNILNIDVYISQTSLGFKANTMLYALIILSFFDDTLPQVLLASQRIAGIVGFTANHAIQTIQTILTIEQPFICKM